MEKKKKNNPNADLEKSIERLENRIDCSMCSISGDMADVLTRVHRLEDNQSNLSTINNNDKTTDDIMLLEFALPLGRFCLFGLLSVGFISMVIGVIRDAVLSILGV